MEKKKLMDFSKQIPRKSRHIRWYQEISPDNFYMDHPMARYHFIVVDDSDYDRNKILNGIYAQISEIHSGLIKMERLNRKVKESRLGYKFVSVDTPVSPDVLNLKKFGLPVVWDSKLTERKVLNLEDYVQRLYED